MPKIFCIMQIRAMSQNLSHTPHNYWLILYQFFVFTQNLKQSHLPRQLLSCSPLNSIMFLLIPVPKPTAYLLHKTSPFCRPLQNISFLSHSSSYVLTTPPILAIFYFCRFPAFFTLSQVDRNHYIFIISSFLLAWHFLLWIQSIKYATLIYKSIYKHKILSEQYS